LLDGESITFTENLTYSVASVLRLTKVSIVDVRAAPCFIARFDL